MIQRALLDTRLAVRRVLGAWLGTDDARGSAPLVLVALSGGADSLALAAALAHEAPKLGLTAGAVIVDHSLQAGSAEVARGAERQAAALGLAPRLVRTVAVKAEAGGPEAAAREARYAAIADAVEEVGAGAVVTAHTRDDQAEQVLLGLARGSGLRSLAGIPPRRDLGSAALLRPFLAPSPEITRATTEGACAEAGLEPWSDPHNTEDRFARVRARRHVLPFLERELGPGIASALARTADLARDDADALDGLAAEFVAKEARVTHEPNGGAAAAVTAIEVSAVALGALPAALRGRAIRAIIAGWYGQHPDLEHTRSVAALVTAWRGQGPIHVPGARVRRVRDVVRFEPQIGSPRAAGARAVEE